MEEWSRIVAKVEESVSKVSSPCSFKEQANAKRPPWAASSIYVSLFTLCRVKRDTSRLCFGLKNFAATVESAATTYVVHTHWFTTLWAGHETRCFEGEVRTLHAGCVNETYASLELPSC